MEINKVGDLIPYHKSLVELWTKEEFLPVLNLLCSLRDEASQEFKSFDFSKPLAQLAIIQTKLKIFGMLVELPKTIELISQGIEAQQKQRDAYIKAQEGGNL